MMLTSKRPGTEIREALAAASLIAVNAYTGESFLYWLRADLPPPN